MWTVLDPEGSFDCQTLLDLASTSTRPGYSFTFPVSVKPVQATPSAHAHPKPNVNVNGNILSSLSRELQLSILEHLPSPSVLNIFLASPDFRRCAEHLPPSFWKSRLLFDVPWSADTILSHIQTAQRKGSGNGKSKVQFDRLLRFLKEFHKAPKQEHDAENLESKGLRNRRRIWLIYERIVREMKVQRGDGNDADHGVKGEGEGFKSDAQD
ncbi:hypothetical protein BDW69DRAFT_6953 [Aspergillus filifer]